MRLFENPARAQQSGRKFVYCCHFRGLVDKLMARDCGLQFDVAGSTSRTDKIEPWQTVVFPACLENYIHVP
jgi:hypothetical protein